MAYKYSNPTVFTNTQTGEKFTCYSQGTIYGFRHIAFKGVVTNPKACKPDAKRTYYNRTWERWQYESVLSDLTSDTDNLKRSY